MWRYGGTAQSFVGRPTRTRRGAGADGSAPTWGVGAGPREPRIADCAAVGASPSVGQRPIPARLHRWPTGQADGPRPGRAAGRTGLGRGWGRWVGRLVGFTTVVAET